MNPIQRLWQSLQTSFPEARITLDEPLVEKGVWSMNVFLSDYHLAIAWQDGKGFGVVADDTHGYGEAADEVFDDYEQTLPRVTFLLAGRIST